MSQTSRFSGPPDERHPIFSLLGFLTGSYAIGLIGSEGMFQGLAGWYMAINRPRWTPPPGVLTPAWTILFGLAGTAAWLVWRNRPDDSKGPLWIFWVQLALTGLWPWLFFAWNLLFVSALVIGGVWVLMLISTAMFFRLKAASGWLMTVVAVWVLLLSATNVEVWRLNLPTKSVYPTK